MATHKPFQKDFLWPILFLILFLNGFEAGGYQASLWSIGQDFDLSLTSMGLFAAMELFATMLAPLLLGRWADRVRKDRSMGLLLLLQLLSSLMILFTGADRFFLLGIFFLGLTTSALQFIAIAALADSYPVSYQRRIGFITGMYATGALVSPLVVDFYLRRGMDWRTLFVLLSLGSALALFGILSCGCAPREEKPASQGQAHSSGKMVLSAILLLGVIMCIYVGFENGFTFFVDTLFTDVLKASTGKLALSLFWAVMIPSRILVGRFSRYTPRILLGALLCIPATMLVVTLSESPLLVLLLCIPLGFASGAIYPCVLTLLVPFAGSHTATATGIITSATGIGGVVFTALTALLADHLGLQRAMLILVSFFALSLLSALLVLKKRDIS